jgi:putative heme-binding domain-containing protein
VIVAQGPDILFLKDTNGDDRYDVKERIIHGMDTADTHHTANSFVLDPGGALYFQEGTFHHTQVETPWGPPRRNANAGVYRYEPRTRKFDVYVTYPFANPHGHAFDRWGQDIVVDGTGAVPYHAPLFSSRLDFPQKHSGTPQIYKQRTRPCPGIEVLSSRHFPDDMQGNLLVGNVIGFQGILCYKVFDKGSSLGATEMEPILYSSDRNFRPADLEIGPDGALYFTDWHNPIIGHMQHNLRDPNRDRVHGRVYRLTCIDRPLETPPRIAGEPIEKLLDLLKAPDDRVRSRARIELSGRDTKEVIAAARHWIQNLDHDGDAANRPHHLLEALWLFQSHNVVDTDLLGRVLHSPSDKARAAAVRVCAYWQDRLPNVLDQLGASADDESPLVRLMAIWAASYVPRPEAAEVVLRAQEHPDDLYLDYLAKEVMRTLGPLVSRAEAEHRPIAFRTQAGARYLLKNLSNEQLLQRKADRLALLELLGRPGLTDAQRHETTEAAAKLENVDESQVVHQALQAIDHGSATPDVSVVFDLLKSLKKSKSRDRILDDYALSARKDILRQLAFASMVNSDGSADAAWNLAVEGKNPSRTVQAFVECVPYISDASVRAALYDRIAPLLDGLPQSLGGTRAPRERPKTDDALASEAFAIRRAAMLALTQIRGRETETFHKLARFIREGVDRPAAIHALQSIPRNAWPKEEAGPLTAVLIEQIRRTPVSRRTRSAALDARELCEALTTLLPPGEAQTVRTQLRELGVRVVKVGTIFERMSYDKDVIAVQAGKPVEFVLENNDLMPHNFVVLEPGSLEEIGLFSEAHAQQPQFAARNYVPRSSKILLSSALLQPRDSAELSFVAPFRPGVYPYVCTYPGHWRRMYGALYVVGDLDAYLADPEKYVANSKLVPRDALLADRRPRTEWTMTDLAAPVEEMSRTGGRSFGSGKQIFTVANCIACHRLEGAGNSFGPDLTKLDPKWKPADILNEILNPSARINEKFQVNVFELGSGKVVTGMVLEETPETIKIIENPLVKAEPIVLRRGDIVDRQRSKTSMMPKGLLDKLTRDEILDLVAYVAAGGSRDRGRFDANPHEHHMHGGSN